MGRFWRGFGEILGGFGGFKRILREFWEDFWRDFGEFLGGFWGDSRETYGGFGRSLEGFRENFGVIFQKICESI